MPLFKPYLQPGEIANLPAYNFYAKLSGGLVPQESLSGMTVLAISGDDNIVDVVIAASRENYAKKYVAPVTQPKQQSKKSVKRKRKKTQSEVGKSANAKSETSSGLTNSEITKKAE